jgi:hypothetical protein
MPTNRRSQRDTSVIAPEQFHLVYFNCDKTYGVFKVNQCRRVKNSDDIVKITYKRSTYDAQIKFTGSKEACEKKAKEKLVYVSCSSDDDNDYNAEQDVADNEYEPVDTDSDSDLEIEPIYRPNKRQSKNERKWKEILQISQSNMKKK